MRTLKSILSVFALIVSYSLLAQQGINYKALIKDNNGKVVANDLIAIQFTILQGAGMVIVYQETHTPTTDDNGIIVVNIGKGSIDSGVYANIDWGADDHFLNVQIDTGGGLTDMGTTQFMAVPYALSVSKEAIRIDDLLDGKSENNDSSLFLGQDSGQNDDGTDNRNVGIGYEAMAANTTGSLNTAYGAFTLSANTTATDNTAIGYLSLNANTIGIRNTANGAYALAFNTEGGNNTATGRGALYQNTLGNSNTANGHHALFSNTTGFENTATGRDALYLNTIGTRNTASGYRALYSNTEGGGNVANGYQALYSNTTGSENTATGRDALYSNTTGIQNTANGYRALYSNEGTGNTANGYFALFANTTGSGNTANGNSSLLSNTIGIHNTACGFRALYSNTEGGYNTASGYRALYSNTEGDYNVANGYHALYSNTTGGYNTAVGYRALYSSTTGQNNIGIGYNAEVPNVAGTGQIRIGNTFITYAGIQVAWTVTSDQRWKDRIRALPYGIDLVKQLKPVDYVRHNNEAKTRETGFIGQDVEALLVKLGYDDQGLLHKDDKGYISLRYNDFIAILTKAIQEQQEIIERLETRNDSYEVRLAKLEKLVTQ